MKRLFTGIVLLAGSLAIMPAHAFLLDGFGDAQDGILDNQDDGTAVTSGDINVSDTDFTSVKRTLTVERTGGAATEGSDDVGTVSAAVAGGWYQYSQDTQTRGTGAVDWTFGPEMFGSPINLLLSVIEADRPGAEVKLELTNADGTFSDSMVLPEVNSAQDFLFTVSGFDTSKPFTSARLSVNGETISALDVTVDFIEIPAPGVLGLLGIGLAGLAFAARRKRDTEVAAV